MLDVLVADDSETNRQLLVYIINSAPDMRVVGQAHNGIRAVTLAARLQPDVVLMDVIMPEMDGLQATREIMSSNPTPIVMISAGIAGRETEVAFEALSCGALTLLNKPVSPVDVDYPAQADQIVRTVRAMASVRVIHHHAPKPRPVQVSTELTGTSGTPEIAVIACSTGGPAALASIIPQLSPDFQLPIVIVQHIAADFLVSLVKWLDGLTALKVSIAEPGIEPQPRHIYLAPGDTHLVIRPNRTFALTDTPVTYHMPSADVLFESVARVYGAQAIGVVLTGMGADGAQGLYRMHLAGGTTIAQDEATSAVFGMPAEAARLGATDHILPLSDIAKMLYTLQKD